MLNKKSIAKLLVFAMILSMLPFSVFAAGSTAPDYVPGVDGAKDSYRLTVDTVTNGTVEVSYTNSKDTTTVSTYYVEEDATVKITAKPDTDYVVAKAVYTEYTVSGDAVTKDLNLKDGSIENVYEFTMPGAPVNVSVTFKKADTSTKHDVTVAKDIQNGTVAITAAEDGTYKFAPDTTVTVTAAPADGYKVGNVSAYKLDADAKRVGSVDVKGSGSTYSFTMPNANVEVTATFVEEGGSEAPKLKVEIVDDEGALDTGAEVTPMDGEFEAGESVTLNITRPNGYNVSVTVNGENADLVKVDRNHSTCTLTMLEDTNVTVTFELRKPNDVTVKWESSEENFLKGELVVDGTIEGMWYVFEMNTPINEDNEDDGSVSAYIAVLGDETDKISVPCAKGATKVKVTEAEKLDLDHVIKLQGNSRSLVPMQTASSVDKTVQRSDDQIENAYKGQEIGAAENPESPDVGVVTTKWESSEENFLKGELVVDGTIENMWYVFEMNTPINEDNEDDGSVSAYIAVLGDNTSKISVPCAKGATKVKVTEAEKLDLDHVIKLQGNSKLLVPMQTASSVDKKVER